MKGEQKKKFYVLFYVFVTKENQPADSFFVFGDLYINISVVFYETCFWVVVKEEEDELEQVAPVSCDGQSAVCCFQSEIFISMIKELKGIIQLLSEGSKSTLDLEYFHALLRSQMALFEEELGLLCRSLIRLL